MTSTVAYIERAEGGLTIRSVRLVSRAGEQVWTAPPTVTGEAASTGVVLAAEWIAGEVARANGAAGPVRLCLDLDGGRCAWLSAPSADHEIVKAAARAASMDAGGDGAGAAGLGAAWSSEHGEVGVDLTVEALDENGGEGPTTKTSAADADRKRRLAVLALPDAPARVLLDELDRLGLDIAMVESLWHAVARAWDPGASIARAPRGSSPDVIEAADPVTACVVVDPAGRLIWAWSRAGRLLAAGVQRLRTLEVARAAPVAPIVDEGGATRRLLDPEQTAPARVIEITRADAGRVVSEWLAWSAQLGLVPSRVVCVGPTDAIASGLAEGAGDGAVDGGGMAAVGQALAVRWPGAAATVVLDDDPIAATLRRAAESAGVAPPNLTSETARAHTDVGLRDLSARPGRLSRSMHWWLAGAITAAAVLVMVAAWRLDRAGRETLEGAEAARGRRAELFKQHEAEFPKLATEPDPVTRLKVALRELQKSREEITPERPVLAVVERVIEAASGVQNLKLKKITVSSVAGVSFDFVAPDAEPGAVLLSALRANATPLLSGQNVQIIWEGDTATSTVPVTGTDPQRVFKLRGIWFDPRGKPGSAPSATSSVAPAVGTEGA